METLTGFDQVKDVASDGFGPIVEGRRGDRTWTIRLFAGVSRLGIPDAMVQRLARPVHAAILPVEVGTTSDGIYLAAPCEGQLLSVLAKQRPGPVVPAMRCPEIGIVLAEAARAVSAAGDGARLGPLSWNNVYLDPARPGLAAIFPLWIARTRSRDWLQHAAPDLMFVDRDTLRQAGAAGADVFAIGAVLLVLAGGAATLPPAGEPAVDVIRRAIVDGHPLAQARPPEGVLSGVIRRALGQPGAGDALDPAGLIRALTETRGAFDPIANAVALYRAGKPLEAMRLLHKALQERESGASALPLQLLKARVEIDQGLVDRALRTLRDACETHPASREVLALLAEHAIDAAEASERYAQAIAVDPLDPDLRLGLALALERAGKLDEAIVALDDVCGIAAVDPSASRAAAQAAVRMGRLLIEKRYRASAAMTMVEPYLTDDDPELRAEALAVNGAAHAEQGAFAQAEKVLREALALERRPRSFVLNHLAHALVATGKRDEARTLVRVSLALDPGQDHLRRLLGALGG